MSDGYVARVNESKARDARAKEIRRSVYVLRFQIFATVTKHRSFHVRYIIVRRFGVTLRQTPRVCTTRQRCARVRTLEVKIFRSRQSDIPTEELAERKKTVSPSLRNGGLCVGRDLTADIVRPYVAIRAHNRFF